MTNPASPSRRRRGVSLRTFRRNPPPKRPQYSLPIHWKNEQGLVNRSV